MLRKKRERNIAWDYLVVKNWQQCTYTIEEKVQVTTRGQGSSSFSFPLEHDFPKNSLVSPWSPLVQPTTTQLYHTYTIVWSGKKMHSCQWSCVKIAPLLGEKSCLRPKNLEKRRHAKKYPCLFSLASLLSQSINENIFFPQPDNCLHTYSTTNLTNPNSRTGAQYCSIDYSAQVSVTRASNRHHHHELDPFSIHHQIKRSRALFVVKAQFFHEKSLVNQC